MDVDIFGLNCLATHSSYVTLPQTVVRPHSHSRNRPAMGIVATSWFARCPIPSTD